MANENQLSLLGNIRRKPANFNPNFAEFVEADLKREALKEKLSKNKPKTPEIKAPERKNPAIITAPSKYFHLTKEMHDEALGRIEADYGNNKILLKVKWDEEAEIARGSNLYYAALINTIFRERGIRTATQADLEAVLRNGALDLKGTYEDSGIVLRTLSGTNEYLAKQIGEQIAKIQNKKVKDLKFPFYIPSRDLDLTNDSNSPSKLGFKLLDSAEIIYATILNSQSGSKFSNSDIDAKTGLPNQLSSGDRTLYTRSDGLSRLDLDRDLDLYSSVGDLAFSYEGGRVLLASIQQDAKPAQNSGGKS
jgi:hypothetical protein